MKTHKMAVLSVLMGSLILISCSENSSKSDPVDNKTTCDKDTQNEWIYEQFHDTYLWYQHTPTLDFTQYSAPNTLVSALKYSRYDHYSFVMDEDEYNNNQQGIETAFGFRLQWVAGQYLFSFISSNSPMYESGIQRGDELLEINGHKITELTNEQWNTFLDTSNGANTQTFLVKNHITGAQKNHSVTSDEFTSQTVFHHEVNDIGGIKTGYLGFSRFMTTSASELNTTFDDLKSQGIKELILDLRYNGGGLIHIAGQLASLIAGNNTSGNVFTTLTFNDRHFDSNYVYDFTSPPQSLDLQRVIVLTTGSTCSASEMVINSLKPFIEVVTIGDTSCGKPIGMLPVSNCGNTLFAINFEAKNANNEGGYYDGIDPTCKVTDIAAGPMWADNDALYKSAQSYITQGQCSASSNVITENKSKLKSMAVLPINPNNEDRTLF